jgi:hypothetical protein
MASIAQPRKFLAPGEPSVSRDVILGLRNTAEIAEAKRLAREWKPDRAESAATNILAVGKCVIKKAMSGKYGEIICVMMKPRDAMRKQNPLSRPSKPKNYFEPDRTAANCCTHTISATRSRAPCGVRGDVDPV